MPLKTHCTPIADAIHDLKSVRATLGAIDERDLDASDEDEGAFADDLEEACALARKLETALLALHARAATASA